MRRRRLSVFALCLGFLVACFSAAGQSVVSTHSGLVYFFEGSVYLQDQPLEQQFGRFPDIGQGNELRTEKGRAEVLLTPGAFLRLADNSSIRMLSTSLSDTRIELLTGSAVVEVREATDTPARMIYKNWQVRLPQEGIYRIDSEPAQVAVHKGEVEVSTDANAEPVSVKEGQVLPLQAVLVTESAPAQNGEPSDAFDKWAMQRSQAIYSDNSTAANIFDDPSSLDNSGLAVGGLGGFSLFPLTGIPALGLGSPYGLSFWSPFQSSLMSVYVPLYHYAPIYPSGLVGVRYPGLPSSGIGTPIRFGGGSRTGVILGSPRAPMPPPRPVAPPHIGVPHMGAGHAIGHR